MKGCKKGCLSFSKLSNVQHGYCWFYTVSIVIILFTNYWHCWLLLTCCSKSEYVRCLHFTSEDTLYVATNRGYLYHTKVSNTRDVKWTELVCVSKEVPIVCMDVLSNKSSELCGAVEDWVAVGDGRGYMTIARVFCDSYTPEVSLTFTWPAGIERQLLGTYWCKSLGYR